MNSQERPMKMKKQYESTSTISNSSKLEEVKLWNKGTFTGSTYDDPDYCRRIESIMSGVSKQTLERLFYGSTN